METKKKCIICGEYKLLSTFYKHKKMADGHLNKCIDCTKRQVKEREKRLREDLSWIEKERERGRNKYYRLEYKDKHKPTKEKKREIMSRYKEKYPEKHLAKRASQNLPKIIKENNLHHWSYNDEHWTDVIELSVKDHNTAHRFMVYDQERKMYRDLDGILLDTKEAHLEYINNFF